VTAGIAVATGLYVAKMAKRQLMNYTTYRLGGLLPGCTFSYYNDMYTGSLYIPETEFYAKAKESNLLKQTVTLMDQITLFDVVQRVGSSNTVGKYFSAMFLEKVVDPQGVERKDVMVMLDGSELTPSNRSITFQMGIVNQNNKTEKLSVKDMTGFTWGVWHIPKQIITFATWSQ